MFFFITSTQIVNIICIIYLIFSIVYFVILGTHLLIVCLNYVLHLSCRVDSGLPVVLMCFTFCSNVFYLLYWCVLPVVLVCFTFCLDVFYLLS